VTTQVAIRYRLFRRVIRPLPRKRSPLSGNSSARGFTLLELMVVLAIAAALAGLAATGFSRSRPRGDLSTVATELHALLRNARQTALLTGRPMVVVVFPAHPNRVGGTGRVVVLEDAAATFFQDTGAPNLGTLDPDAAGADAVELPRSLAFGPDTGLGAAATLPAPYERIAVNVSCGFCGADRGAIRFDSSGHATFHASNGAPLELWGASLSLTAPDLEGAVRTLLVTATTGSVRTLAGG
jgi:prepilin-type N-terminal cleavage/methylation domain-containing protein